MVWEAQWNHYLGLGHHNSDPRGDPRPRGVPRGDPRGVICDSYDVLVVVISLSLSGSHTV